MQKEVWKDIPGYEDYYQVSNLGRVKGLTRKVKNRNGFSIIKENHLKQTLSLRGYYVVGLFNNSKGKTMNVHQLVSMAFLGHKPDGTFKLIVDHIDNDKLNNRVENLQIISQRENASKDKKNKTSKYTGVSWDSKNKKWTVGIRINGISKNLGRFNSEEDAYLVYKNKLKEIEKI